jgi:hypothetical protein
MTNNDTMIGENSWDNDPYYYPCPNCGDAVDKTGPMKDKCIGCDWTPTDATYAVNKEKIVREKRTK